MPPALYLFSSNLGSLYLLIRSFVNSPVFTEIYHIPDHAVEHKGRKQGIQCRFCSQGVPVLVSGIQVKS